MFVQYVFVACTIDKLGQFKTFTLSAVLVPFYCAAVPLLLLLGLFTWSWMTDRCEHWDDDGIDCFSDGGCWIPTAGFMCMYGIPTTLIVCVYMAAAGSISWFPMVPIFLTIPIEKDRGV